MPVTHRGKGIGVALARSAFERVRSSEFPVSLFQTTIPVFYRKLGATVVEIDFSTQGIRVTQTQIPGTMAGQ